MKVLEQFDLLGPRLLEAAVEILPPLEEAISTGDPARDLLIRRLLDYNFEEDDVWGFAGFLTGVFEEINEKYGVALGKEDISSTLNAIRLFVEVASLERTAYVHDLMAMQAFLSLMLSSPTEETDHFSSKWVYLFCVESAVNTFKIGISAYPTERRRHLNSMPGVDVEILHIFPATDAREAERILHKRFDAKKVELEYFNLDPGDIAWLCSIRSYSDGRFITK
ncbi:MAG: GIY-YIG nuclease family protein [Chloroflexota bacterium]